MTHMLIFQFTMFEKGVKLPHQRPSGEDQIRPALLELFQDSLTDTQRQGVHPKFGARVGILRHILKHMTD